MIGFFVVENYLGMLALADDRARGVLSFSGVALAWAR